MQPWQAQAVFLSLTIAWRHACSISCIRSPKTTDLY